MKYIRDWWQLNSYPILMGLLAAGLIVFLPGHRGDGVTYTVWVWTEPHEGGYALRVRAQPAADGPAAPQAKAVGTGLTESEAKEVIDQAAREGRDWL